MDRRTFAAAAVRTAVTGAVAAAASCGKSGKVVVGAKDFAEQDILGELLAQQLERHGIPVERKLHLGGTLIAHQALVRGDIDLYPEYTGTALTSSLKLPLEKGKEAVFVAVRKTYQQRHGIEFGWRLGFENTFAFVAARKKAEGLGIRKLSQAAQASTKWRVGVGYEFEQRPDGWPAFVREYPLPLDGKLRTMDLGLLYRALDAGEADLVAGNSTDAALSRPEFLVLEDDRQFFPPYEACLAVREATLTRVAGLRGALDELTNRISTAAMRTANYQLTVERKNVAEIAANLLRP